MRIGQIALVVFFTALLVVTALFSWHEWSLLPGVEISTAGWIALVLGSVFTLALGGGLMFLVFYSSRHGYDGQDKK